MENHHQQQSGERDWFWFIFLCFFLVFTFPVCRLRVVASSPKLHLVFCIVKLRCPRLGTMWESVVVIGGSFVNERRHMYWT